jgi:hypothetical protein
VADATADADLRDRRENHVLRPDPARERALYEDPQRLRLLLPDALRRENLFQLGGADAERKPAERPMR